MEGQTTVAFRTTPADAPPLTRLKKRTNQLVRQLSEDSIQSPTMPPEYVVLEVRNEETGEVTKKTVYVSDQNGTKTLDLYSGWNPESQKHKLPLKTLPMKVCQLISLERLWVSHNKLTSLPHQLDQLTNLRELFLHRNNFDTIPPCLCKLSHLHLLWLNNNKITSIPDDIAKLSSLKRLHLDFNFIEDFPESLCQLKQLEVLYLNGNSLHNISESIGNLRNLKRLYLQNNKISDLPPGLTALTKIVMLFLDDNEIRNLRRDFTTYRSSMESMGSVISMKNNPFVTPQSKLKLSLAGISPPQIPLKTRRLSEQFEREGATRRPARVSLPINSDSVHKEYKADTLPRTSGFHPKHYEQ